MQAQPSKKAASKRDNDLEWSGASLTRWRDPVNFIKKAIVAAGLVAASTSAFAADITGAGATFPFPVYSKWG